MCILGFFLSGSRMHVHALLRNVLSLSPPLYILDKNHLDIEVNIYQYSIFNILIPINKFKEKAVVKSRESDHF